VDSQSALLHSAALTAANVNDKHPCTDRSGRVDGDSACASPKELIRSKAPNAHNLTNERMRRAGGQVDEVQRDKNRNESKSRVRAK
jgi:IS5 family transposase